MMNVLNYSAKSDFQLIVTCVGLSCLDSSPVDRLVLFMVWNLS